MHSWPWVKRADITSLIIKVIRYEDLVRCCNLLVPHISQQPLINVQCCVVMKNDHNKVY